MSEVIVTQYGLEKIAAAAKHGTPLNATAMVVGDGAPTSIGIGGNTVYTIPSPVISIDPGNPTRVVAKGTIPLDTQTSFVVGSIALMDDDNAIAIAGGSGNIKHGLDHSHPQAYEIELVIRLSNEASGPGPGSGSNGYSVYGVQIDLTDSNPETCVTYIEDAIGVVPGGSGASEWDSKPIFKDIKPVLLVNGAVSKYLNPNNFAQEVGTGLTAAISSASPGDVMIEIPKIGYQITPSNNGDTITIRITDEPDNPNYKYYAHTRITEGDRDKLYIGAYLGWQDGSNKLRSVSGVTPAASQTIATFIQYATNRGSGYDIVGFYPLMLLQILYLIRSKNLNSQEAIGLGFTGGSAAAVTGATNALGMNYGTQSDTNQMKCLGIEDFWGNVRWWIGGCFYNANFDILTAFKDFNDNGNGYVNRGHGAEAQISGYITKIQGTSETGFIPKAVDGSGTTHFCDLGLLGASRLPNAGGSWTNGAYAGAFYLNANTASYSSAAVGARLMYL